MIKLQTKLQFSAGGVAFRKQDGRAEVVAAGGKITAAEKKAEGLAD